KKALNCLFNVKCGNDNMNWYVFMLAHKELDIALDWFYMKNFNNTKNELINKKQITINDNSFINDIKNDRCLVIKTSRHKLKDKIAEITNINVKSDQTLVGNFTYSHLGDNKKYLYKDVIRNIINCVYDSYLSYLALRQKGIKC